MSDKFTALDRRTFKNYIELMQELTNAGFDNEFDNSLVIKAITAKIDLVWAASGSLSGIYLQTLCENDSQGEKLLKITIRSTVSERAQESLIVFAQGDAIKVSSNVLVEPVKDFNKLQKVLLYPYLSKSDAMKLLESLRDASKEGFPKYAIKTAAALFEQLAPSGSENQLLASISVDKEKLKIQYQLNIHHMCTVEYPIKSKA